MIKLILFFFIHLFLNKFLTHFKILLDKQEISEHKQKVITNKYTPLTCGLIFIIFFFFTTLNNSFYLFFVIFSLYLLGLLSDLDILASPLKRIIFQTSIILLSIFLFDLQINSVSIDTIDKILEIKFFNIFFTLMCLLVLINGFNLMDGLNTLVLGYFIFCLTALYFTSKQNNFYLDYKLIEDILIILSIMIFFNFFGKSFLGDSGTYSIGFLIGIISIKFAYENYSLISPYFVASILWYPAIENLFSILRRIYLRKKLSNADNNHLHHLVYSYLKNNGFLKNKEYINSLSGILINFYNLITLSISIYFINSSKILLILILTNILVYLILYFNLNRLVFFKK